MTDKQIIVDGVDIGWCKNYNEANSKDCETLYICAENPNCYYKQLKRKEQECEELKEKYLKLKEQNGSNIVQLNTVNEQLDQLKAENEELKKLLKVRIEDLCDSCGASSMMPMPCKVYEKTLTEIKEIAEDESYIGFWDEQISKILQKISEVEK